MATTERRILRLEVDARQYKRVMKEVGGSLKNIEEHSKRASKSLKGMAATMRTGVVAAAAVMAARVARSIFSTVTSFEDLRTSMEAVTGSAEVAASEFERINTLTTQTPFQVEQMTEAYVKLAAAGITPTNEQLMLFSDVASVTTDRLGSLQAMTDLFARTTAGGLGLEDLNRLADRGVPVFDILNEKLGITRLEIGSIGKTAEGSARILDALSEGLEERFGGASQLALENLSVAMSNLQAAIKNVVDAMFNSTGATSLFAKAIVWVTDGLNTLATFIRDEISPGLGLIAEDVKALIGWFKELGADENSVIGKVVQAFGWLWEKAQPIINALLKGPALIVTEYEKVRAFFAFRLPAAFETVNAGWQRMQSVALNVLAQILDGILSLVNDGINKYIEGINSALEVAQSFGLFEGAEGITPVDIGGETVADLSRRSADRARLAEEASRRANDLMRQYADALTKTKDAAGGAAVAIEQTNDATTKLSNTIKGGKTGGGSDDEEGETFMAALIKDVGTLSEQGLDTLIDAIGKADFSFKNFARNFLREISKMIIKMTIMTALKNAFGGFGFANGGVFGGGSGGGGSTASALGNAFAGGAIAKFAKGGVLGGPTLAPMALMGEAGPEAVMPLSRRTDGTLGIAAPAVNMQVINNNGSQIDVSQDQSGLITIAVNQARQAVQQDFALSMSSGQGAYARSFERGFVARRRTF